MDAEFAKTLPGGQRIAHGTMIFSIGVGLTASLINPVAFSYGYDRLRFVRPVHIGDTIRTRVTIAAKEDDPKRPGPAGSSSGARSSTSAARSFLPRITF